MDQPEKFKPEAGSLESGNHARKVEEQLLLELRRSMEVCLRDQERALQLFAERLRSPAREAGRAAAPVAQGLPEPRAAGEDAQLVAELSGKGSQETKVGKENSQLVRDLNGKVSFSNYSATMGRRFCPSERPSDSLMSIRTSSPNLIARALWCLYYFVKGIQEPERHGQLARFVRSHRFEFLTMVMILIHGAVIVYETDRNGRAAVRDPAGLRDHVDGHWDLVLEYVFLAYFLLELVLKLMVHKLYFFCNKEGCWNTFDFLTIAITVLDVFMSLMGASIAAVDADFLRVLRIFRLAKSLRIMRALHFVNNFRKILQCVISSLSHIIWSFLLLIFITTIFATVLCQTVTQFLVVDAEEAVQGDVTPEDLEQLRIGFGTVSRAVLSLFKATSGGSDWGNYYNQLAHIGFLAPVIIVFYVLFFLIAAWNIVTSLFLEKALMIAQPDIDTQLMEKRQQELADAQELMSLVASMDEDSNGFVGQDEFVSKLRVPRVHAFLELRNIDIKDAEMFFHLLQAAAHTPDIPVQTLVNALMKMRGVATNMDLQTLQFQIQVQNAANAQSFRTIENHLCDIRSVLTSRGGSPLSI